MATMNHPTNPEAVAVERDGPRGWHWITKANFDPKKHKLYETKKAEGEQPET